MQPAEIQADMIAHVPALEALFEKWSDSSGVGATNFQPNAVGIAIGHACQRKAVNDMSSLDSFMP
jgi:hypothetical protein